MWHKLVANHPARTLALAFCLGVVLGGSLPELGNITDYYAFKDITYKQPHMFNGYFLVAGILGVIVCGIALYRRLLQSTSDRMVRRDG